MSLAWQIILRTRDNRVLALDHFERRAWSSTINALGRALHAHLRPEAEWEAARFSPVRDQAHLLSASRYVLGQDEHHGIAQADRFLEGTELPPSPPWLHAVDGQWTLQSAPTPAPRTG